MQKKSFLQGLNALGSNWFFVGMHGQMPTQEPEMQLVDLIRQGVCVFEAQSLIRNDNHLKFTNIGSLIPYVGGVDGEPSALGFERNIINISADENGLDFVKFLTQEKTTTLGVGDSFVYDPEGEIVINTLQLDSPVAVSNLLLEIEVEGVWEIVGEVVGVKLDSFSINKTVTKLRVTNTSASAQETYNCLKVFSNQKPETQNAPKTIEWCLMLPKNPVALASVYGEDLPYGWIDCSGPNDGASCILNTANPKFNEDVRLLYLTLQPAVVEF